MPAEKAARVAERRRLANRRVRNATRTVVRKAVALIEQGKLEEAEPAVRHAMSALDKAAQKGVIHSNAADRSKARLAARLNKGKGATS